MPIDVCGFVEVSNMGEAELHEPHMWQSCLDIGCFLLGTDDVCRILFGESKLSEYKEWPPVAKRRGLPSNLTPGTAREVAWYQEMAAAGEPIWGYTSISYQELKQVDWQAYPGADLEPFQNPGWYALFRTMDLLAEYFAHQRLVVWFVW